MCPLYKPYTVFFIRKLVFQWYKCVNTLFPFYSLSTSLWYGHTTGTVTLTIHPKGCWVVSSFWLLQIMLLRTLLYRILWEPRFSFLWDEPWTVIAGLCDGCKFSAFRNAQTAFQSGCTISHSQEQWMSGQFPSLGCRYEHPGYDLSGCMNPGLFCTWIWI